MEEILLNDTVIENIKKEAAEAVKKIMGENLIQMILYGSCARGDYTLDSDIDIALITACDRIDAKIYSEQLSEISMCLAMKYFAIVNFVCLPYTEFTKNKSWYLYFQNIATEGEVLYG